MPEDMAALGGIAGNVALLVDDDEFFRIAMQTLLKAKLGFSEAIETDTVDDAVECLTRRGADIRLVLFDLNLPGMNNWAALRSVREGFPQAIVAVVSASNRARDVLMALDAGVHGYVYKGSGVSELTHALTAICEGTVYVPPSLPQMALCTEHAQVEDGMLPAAGSGDQQEAVRGDRILGQMTPRQSEILHMLVDGMANKEMARALDLSESAVKFHLSALMRKLDVSNRTEAAAAGVRLLSSGRINLRHR